MELYEYPRPANDTGIGLHWSAGYATAIGMRKIRDFWIPEMQSLGIKWVKIYNHDGALDFAEALLAEGIMPIVRIYRPTPNPSRLDVKDVVQIDAFVRAGVRYFEFNSEPDRDAEWKGGRMPANGINLAVENTIANLEIILERGGMPAIPALANGSRWDLVGKIVAFGRKDLFAGPVWQAVHNYSRNRPLDYPYDIGNQEGAAYTYRFYQVLNEEAWEENAWRGRSLEEVNRLRQDRSNPGATIMDDPACWLAYEYFDALNRKHLGSSIPILSTECGYLVGEDVDPRYPATSPDLHMAQTLEACRVMMGVSQRFAPAPDYYFCSAFWLLGNTALGSTSSWWENHAWYSERWPGGALPIVYALKSEPKVARHWLDETADDLITLQGTVAYAGPYQTLILERNGQEINRVTLDQNSRYVMPNLASGAYLLRIEGAGVEQKVELAVGQHEMVVNFDLTPASAPVNRSRIEGSVRGGSGAVLLLVRAGDGKEWVTMARDDGSFRFVDLPSGEYSLRVNPEGSRIDRIMLDGINQRQVELAVAGWGHTTRTAAEGMPGNRLYCRVDGYRGLPVRVYAGEWSSEPVYTGTASEIGDFACMVGPLEPGHYIVGVDGVPGDEGRYVELEARVHLDGKRAPLVEFVYTDFMATPVASHSTIVGRVIGGKAARTTDKVCLVDSTGQRQEQTLSVRGDFRFEDLPAGLYTVALAGRELEVSRTDIALDGNNQVTVELQLPLELDEEAPTTERSQSVIAGVAPKAAGQVVRLVDQIGNEYQQVVDADDHFRFTNLPAGVYKLSLEVGYVQNELTVNGSTGLAVHFAELSPIWEAEVSSAGSMPGYSVVRVEVEGMKELPVHIWKEDWDGMVRRTGSKPEFGPYTLEFSPLGPGKYMVEPEGLGLWSEIELTGLEALWIHFRKRTLPLGENQIESISLPDSQAVFIPEGDLPVAASAARQANPAHYLYIYTPPTTVETLTALLHFATEAYPTIGRDRWAAFEAERVTIVSNDKKPLELTEFVHALEAAGIQVDYFTASSSI
ncbi:MAG: carboxypeptidase-like regulatory domain-containing protein [Caldilineaceae bacterium]